MSLSYYFGCEKKIEKERDQHRVHQVNHTFSHINRHA